MTFPQFYTDLISQGINPRSKEAYAEYRRHRPVEWSSWQRMVYREEKRRQTLNTVDLTQSAPTSLATTKLTRDNLIALLEQETINRNRRLTNQDLFEIGQPYGLDILSMSRVIDPHSVNGVALSATIDSIFKLQGLSVKEKIRVAELEAVIKTLRTENKLLIDQRLKHSDLVNLIRSAVSSFDPLPADPFDWEILASADIEDAVLMLSDFHWEERVDRDEVVGVNEYSIEIAKARIDTVFNKLLERLSQLQIVPRVTVCILGDMLNGLINEGEVDRQVGSATAATSLADYLSQKIALIAQKTPVRVYTVCGNHGRVKQEPFFKKYAEENLDTFMYLFMQRRLERAVPEFTVGMAPYVFFDLQNGQRVLIAHGHQFKGGSGFNPVPNTISRDMAKLRGDVGEFDYLLVGHFHSEGEIRAFGGEQKCFLNGSLVGGTPYSIATVKRADLPSQTLLLFDSNGLHSKHVLEITDN